MPQEMKSFQNTSFLPQKLLLVKINYFLSQGIIFSYFVLIISSVNDTQYLSSIENFFPYNKKYFFEENN